MTLMPILPIALQRRHAELGRIRLGDKGAKGQPQKLSQFRFTSPLERHIRDLAQLYGGTAQEWKNGTATEWEVYTTASSIPVVVVKGGLSQWLELWSGGGCQRRCDGETETLSNTPCICEIEGGDRKCKPTTRLSVMLPELEAIGVFRLETHGWNAAATLPNMHDLAAYLGDLVPARLMLKEQKTVANGKTNRFVVPVLDLEVSASRLTALVQQANGGVIGALEQQDEVRAIEATQTATDYREAIAACETADEVRTLWHRIKDAGHMSEGWAGLLTARAEELKGADTSSLSVDDAWQAMVAEAGRHGLTASQIDAALIDRFTVQPDELTALQLVEFTQALKDGQDAA